MRVEVGVAAAAYRRIKVFAVKSHEKTLYKVRNPM
jgi:hypothetical protein